MPFLDESDYIPTSGEEEDARNTVARGAENEQEHADDASFNSPPLPPRPQRAKNRRQARRRPIFRNKHGAPMCFFFGPGVQASSKEGLSKRIQDHGGQVVLVEEETDILLVGPKYSEQNLEAKQASYHYSADSARRNIMVEKTSFVKDCIEGGKVRHKRKRGTQQGFRKAEGRTEYTTDDEKYLCRFLWQATLRNAGKGRTGIKLYKTMYSMGEHAEEHKWTIRHTPESWRNRYKKHRERLDSMIDEIAIEASEDIRRHFEKRGRDGPVELEDDNDEDAESENDGELEFESEEERPQRKRRAVAVKGKPQRARHRPRPVSASPPPASRSRLRRNPRKKEIQPESEEEEEEEEEEAAEEEMHQAPDSLFDGPYDEPTFGVENTQATLVNLSAERRQDVDDIGPYNSDHRARKTGKQVARTQASEQHLPPPSNAPSQPELPRRAARRPRPLIPSPPPHDDLDGYIPHSSPFRQRDNNGSPAQRQQGRPMAADMPPNLTPGITNTERARPERPQPFSSRRLTLPRPIVAKPASPQASSSRVQPPQNMPQAQSRPAQGIYPVITPNHHIGPAMSTPARRGSASSFDSDSSNFPTPGTKADAMKRILRENHVRTPYTAAPGTRAAAYLSQGM